MTQKKLILNALASHYEAQIHKNEALLHNYLNRSAGIGEHPDIIEECVKIVDNLASAKDSLSALREIVNE